MRAEAIKELFDTKQGRSARIHEMADVYRDEVALETILPNPYQPRMDLTPDRWDFVELVASIRNHGLLQPVVVTPHAEEKDRFILIAGERRWRAVRELFKEGIGNGRIAATVLRLKESEVRDAELLCKALSENLIRSNLETSELAMAIANLRDISGWTYDQIAQRLGVSVKRVNDLAAIAKHPPVLCAVRDGTINQMQATRIAHGCDTDEEALELVGKAAGKDVHTTERMIKAMHTQKAPMSIGPAEGRVITPPPQVDVDRLPLARLVGGGMTPREEIYKALDRTCAVLGYWPEKP